MLTFKLIISQCHQLAESLWIYKTTCTYDMTADGVDSRKVYADGHAVGRIVGSHAYVREKQ